MVTSVIVWFRQSKRHVLRWFPSPYRDCVLRLAMRPLIVLFAFFMCTVVLFAQKKQSQVPPQKKLSSAEKQWCSVIESSLAGMADLQPAMRSLALDMIAGGLKKCDPRAVRRVLIDAFLNSLAIPDSEEDLERQTRADTGFDHQRMRASVANLETKRNLQTESLTHLLAEDQRKVESLLPQAEPSVRTDLLRQMISDAVAAKKLDQALNLLKRSPREGFPYGEATNLMLELPPASDTEREEIFGWAMAADQEHHSFVVGGDDFGSMIVRFWRHLATAVVLQAISQVLDGAQSNKSGISLGSGSNRASFDSEYQYRVFEFLPILRELDSDQADRLLRDSPEAQAQLKDFPNGIQSLNPAIRDTPLRKGEEASTGGMVGMGIAPMLQQAKITEAYESRIAEIARVAESNPQQAIAAASGLPNSAGTAVPRAKALLNIAQVAMSKNPLAARDALEAMSESLRNVEPNGPSGPRDYWAEGIEIATKIEEIDLAKKLLKEGIGQAEKLRSKDTDSDDPNLAMKAWWPSTAMLAKLILAASRISSRTALDATQEITDPEIRLFCQVRLANRQLGARVGHSSVMVNRKESAWSEYRVAED